MRWVILLLHHRRWAAEVETVHSVGGENTHAHAPPHILSRAPSHANMSLPCPSVIIHPLNYFSFFLLFNTSNRDTIPHSSDSRLWADTQRDNNKGMLGGGDRISLLFSVMKEQICAMWWHWNASEKADRMCTLLSCTSKCYHSWQDTSGWL